ncbi:AI-2E family transporter [Nonomuraea sp. MCN248]|uniref:AI-2E family transporter n=1 Tax=Nonomuraea corallina TaxID=2989783 RepID=A0ABT4S8L1_9ACTN|nr:AI-2E family transporter [Nonomuraea corallina]MDA0633562.1 AI-2E family transporter [Nonomuraea corallina]
MATTEKKEPAPAATIQVLLSPGNVWRAGLVVIAVLALAMFLRFVLIDAGSFLFLVVLAWFLSLAMEPAVSRLARHMRRGAAAGLVMAGLALAGAIFLVLFGQLFVEQVALLVRGLPEVLTAATEWINARFGTNYNVSDILASIKLTPQQAAGYAQGVLAGVLGVLGTVAGAVFNAFTLMLLTFYLSADGPRARQWLARQLPGRTQQIFVSVWDISLTKTGGYVAARLILSLINGITSTIVFLLLGMPSWLALGVWTGVVAQFVPTIGTYIAIALPVVVGLVSDRPWIGLAALAWGILYQQVENLTLEPRISGWGVDVHPGVSFSAAIMGALLFGLTGALLAIPTVAMLLSLLETFGTRHKLEPRVTPADAEEPAADAEKRAADAEKRAADAEKRAGKPPAEKGS